MFYNLHKTSSELTLRQPPPVRIPPKGNLVRTLPRFVCHLVHVGVLGLDLIGDPLDRNTVTARAAAVLRVPDAG